MVAMIVIEAMAFCLLEMGLRCTNLVFSCLMLILLEEICVICGIAKFCFLESGKSLNLI
jgi:hypothetical protein